MHNVIYIDTRRPAKRPLSPASLAAPALMAGVVWFTVYAAATMTVASTSAAYLNAWRA